MGTGSPCVFKAMFLLSYIWRMFVHLRAMSMLVPLAAVPVCVLSPTSWLSKGWTFHLLLALHFQHLLKLVFPGSLGHRRFLLSRCTRIISLWGLCWAVWWCSQNITRRLKSRGKKIPSHKQLLVAVSDSLFLLRLYRSRALGWHTLGCRG